MAYHYLAVPCQLVCALQEVDHLGRPRHEQQPRQQRVRPFIPAGRNSSPDVLLKGQAADMLAGLDAALSKDWPHSFIKVGTAGSNTCCSAGHYHSCHCMIQWRIFYMHQVDCRAAQQLVVPNAASSHPRHGQTDGKGSTNHNGKHQRHVPHWSSIYVYVSMCCRHSWTTRARLC